MLQALGVEFVGIRDLKKFLKTLKNQKIIIIKMQALGVMFVVES